MFNYFVEPAGRKRGARVWANHRRTTLLTISSALLAVAPKCPICFLAYFGIFGVATASASVYRVWLPPLTALWLGLTVAMLAFGRDTGRKAGPVFLSVMASIAVLVGKFIVDDQKVILAGLAGLLTAIIWRSWSRKRARVCNQCEDQPQSSRKRLDVEVLRP